MRNKFEFMVGNEFWKRSIPGSGDVGEEYPMTYIGKSHYRDCADLDQTDYVFHLGDTKISSIYPTTMEWVDLTGITADCLIALAEENKVWTVHMCANGIAFTYMSKGIDKVSLARKSNEPKKQFYLRVATEMGWC